MSIKICLDAGHDGKYNRSPVVQEYYESDFNWKLHLKLKKELESWGIEVITTRATQSEAMGLQTRGKKSKGCNAFLSLHANAAERESADHPVIIVPVNGSGTKLGEKLGQTISQVMNTNEAQDIRTKANNNGADWYGVINGATSVGVPGIILEHSFYTNKRMAEWMMVDSNLDKLAKAEAKTIAEYYGVEKINTPIEPAVKVVAGDLVSITTNAVYYTGQNIPNWVKQKNWYVSKVTSDFCVVDKSEDGTNAICSPIEEKYLVKIVKVAEPTPTPEPIPEPVAPPVETKPEPIPEVEFTPAPVPEEQLKPEQNETPAPDEKKTKSILQLIIEIIKAIVGIFGK